MTVLVASASISQAAVQAYTVATNGDIAIADGTGTGTVSTPAYIRYQTNT